MSEKNISLVNHITNVIVGIIRAHISAVISEYVNNKPISIIPYISEIISINHQYLLIDLCGEVTYLPTVDKSLVHEGGTRDWYLFGLTIACTISSDVIILSR